jgi:hypothetical protein
MQNKLDGIVTLGQNVTDVIKSKIFQLLIVIQRLLSSQFTFTGGRWSRPSAIHTSSNAAACPQNGTLLHNIIQLST